MKYYKQSKESEVNTEAILIAYDALTYREKESLNKLTNPLMKRCNGLSREGAIEIIGKLGIVLANNGRNR